METKIIKPSELGCSFARAIRNYFVHYTTFSGRSSRSEYWYWVLFNFIMTIPYLLFLCYYLNVHSYEKNFYLLGDINLYFITVYMFWSACTFVSNIALMIRRLHDSGKSGYWTLLLFIPVVGAVIVFIVLALLETECNVNQYGAVLSHDYPSKNTIPIGEHRPAASAPESFGTDNIDIANELQRYGKLLEQGMLTQAEYDNLKRRLLNL